MLIGGGVLLGALGARAALAGNATHPLAALARRELHRRSSGSPHPLYLRRLELELAALHQRGCWPVWQAEFDLVTEAQRDGVLVVADDAATLSSLAAHLLGLTKVDPVQWSVPPDYLLHDTTHDFVDLTVSKNAPLDFVRRAGPTKVDARAEKGDTPERFYLHFERELVAPVVVRLWRDQRLNALQTAISGGFNRRDVDLAAVGDLVSEPGGFAPPFDREDTAWVAEGFRTFEEVSAALAIMRVEDNGWEPRPVLDDLWRVFFARGNDVPPMCEPFVEATGELVLYNEQVGRITAKVAGFSFEEARRFRLAASSRRRDRMPEWRERFIQRSRSFSGLSTTEADRVCEFLWRHPLLHRSRGLAVAETAEWIWTTHALRRAGADGGKSDGAVA